MLKSQSQRPAVMDDDELRSELDLLISMTRRRLALRHWERRHLPIDNSQLGYELLMAIGPLSILGMLAHGQFLKQLYLALPYSEKGIRLHLRRLELTGWVNVLKTGKGSRTSRVELTDRYWVLMESYAKECDRIDAAI
jgi:hypothetical protein